MKEMEAIEMLSQVMMGERKENLPRNSVQEHRSVQNKEQARGWQVKEAEQPSRNKQATSTPTTSNPKHALSPVPVADIPALTEAKNNGT